jgi:hypothetical protein
MTQVKMLLKTNNYPEQRKTDRPPSGHPRDLIGHYNRVHLPVMLIIPSFYQTTYSQSRKRR